ncbi:MAG: hypothetical protein AAB133_00660, partial [Pseudomonadota bacterium]
GLLEDHFGGRLIIARTHTSTNITPPMTTIRPPSPVSPLSSFRGSETSRQSRPLADLFGQPDLTPNSC